MQTTHCVIRIIRREVHRLVSRPLYLFCMIIAPLLCCAFFTSLMKEGLPQNLPVGVVDQDNTSTTRNMIRNLDAFSQTGIAGQYATADQARQAIQQGTIYAFYYIPQGTTQKLISGRQPIVSFYTNNSFLIAGSLIYRDMRILSVLAGGSATLQTLKAKGVNEESAKAFLQPIVLDTHALNNPWLNYSVYLNNTILPGILMLMIFMVTIYAIGSELKYNTAREWLAISGNHIGKALLGKLLPHTVIFFLVATAYDAYLYGFLHFPCHSGAGPLLFASLLMVLASQAFGVFLISLLPTLRLALSVSSLWGMVSFSISGFTFPVMAMHPSLQVLSNLFPLRHYFLIYVNQTLNGYPVSDAWKSYLALCLFLILPFFFLKRLKMALLNFNYIP